MKRYTRILAAIDRGSTQRLVAERAVALAKENGASLMFAHVIEFEPTGTTGLFYESFCDAEKARLEENLADLLAEARAKEEIPSCELVVRVGRVTDELTRQISKEFEPDLVVCGNRGLSGLKSVLHSSVSSFLVRNLDCDVLVIKRA